MSEDRDKLKALLLSEEIAQIEAIHKLLNDHKKFSIKVSEVLDSASDLTIKKNPEFQKKFSKVDSKAYVRAIKANKQTFIDAMLPIIGPMIRKSVSNAISRFVSDVNRAMELGFSFKALKWRWQSLRTGVPFAELVFSNTIAYQVQHVFLIDKNTGLLVEYAGQEDALLQDKEAMSAMLTAIQDFVKDSIDSDSQGLSAAKLGDQSLELITGTQANLVAIIKGAYTNRLTEKLNEANEELHLDFKQDLYNQKKWNNNPELKLQLQQLLVTKSQSDDDSKSSINFWPWLILFSALLIWVIWGQYKNNKQLNAVNDQLSNTPGFVLQNLTQQGNSYVATGLLDPIADTSQLDPNIQLNTTPYISLDDSIVLSRVKKYLNDANISIQIADGHLTLHGKTNHNLNAKVENLLLLPGVVSVSNHINVYNIEQQLSDFLTLHQLPPHLTVDIKNNEVVLSGELLIESDSTFLNQLKQQFTQLNSESLSQLSSKELINSIEQQAIHFVSFTSLNTSQLNKLQMIYNQFKSLLKHHAASHIKLIAKSDCQGSTEESNQNNQLRLQLMKQQLTTMGLDKRYIQSDIVPCLNASSTVDYKKIGVWFEVIE